MPGCTPTRVIWRWCIAWTCPTKLESVFGVQMVGGTQNHYSYPVVQDAVDVWLHKRIPFLPYELVVSDATAHALSLRFRMLVSFPNATHHSISSILSMPSALEKSVKAVARYQLQK
jgi:hypothetical protein